MLLCHNLRSHLSEYFLSLKDNLIKYVFRHLSGGLRNGLSLNLQWYEFAIPESFMELPHVQAFIEVLKSDAFKAELECLGGYGTERAGEIRWIN